MWHTCARMPGSMELVWESLALLDSAQGLSVCMSFMLNNFCRFSNKPLFFRKVKKQNKIPVQNATKASNLPRTRKIISQLVQPLNKYSTLESFISSPKCVLPRLGYILLSAHTTYAGICCETFVQNSEHVKEPY